MLRIQSSIADEHLKNLHENFFTPSESMKIFFPLCNSPSASRIFSNFIDLIERGYLVIGDIVSMAFYCSLGLKNWSWNEIISKLEINNEIERILMIIWLFCGFYFVIVVRLIKPNLNFLVQLEFSEKLLSIWKFSFHVP